MKNKFEFVDSKSMTRGAEHTRCGLCDSGYDKWTYQYVKVVEGPADGLVICPECLKKHDFEDDVPTYEEWREREKAADKEYVACQTA